MSQNIDQFLNNYKGFKSLNFDLNNSKSEQVYERLKLTYSSPKLYEAKDDGKEILSAFIEDVNKKISIGQKSIKIKVQDLRKISSVILNTKVDKKYFKIIITALHMIRDRKCIRELFNAYIFYFNKDDKYIKSISLLINENKNLLSSRWKKILSKHNLLDSENIEEILSDLILSSDNPEIILNNLNLTSIFLGSALLETVLINSANKILKFNDSEQLGYIDKFEKIVQSHGKIVDSLSTPSFIALLEPFENKPIDSNRKKRIQNLFINTYKDPRLYSSSWPKIKELYGGNVRREKCIQIIKKWLVSDTIKLFLEVIKNTADTMFEKRKKLWEEYLNQGLVIDARVVFGKNAEIEAMYLSKEEGKEDDYIWSKVSGSGFDKNQSVLLLKMEGVVIIEWSHSGRVHFFKDENPYQPSLTELTYEVKALRGKHNDEVKSDQSYVHDYYGRWVYDVKKYLRDEYEIFTQVDYD